MIAKNILKRLLSTFLLALGVSAAWWFSNSSHLHGEEEQHIHFVLLILNIGVCVISGLLSLTALLNTKTSIASNKTYSLLSFIGLPFLLLVALLSMFFINSNSPYKLRSFLELGIPSIVYFLALVFHYFSFRNWYKKYSKQP